MIIAEFSCLIQGLTSKRRIRSAVQKFINSTKGVAIELAVAKHISKAEQNARPKIPIGSANFGNAEPLDLHVPSFKARTCCGWPWWPFRAQVRHIDLELGERSPQDGSISNVPSVQSESPKDTSTNFDIRKNRTLMEAVFLGVIDDCRFGELFYGWII